MNDILARRARRATVGIALSAALAAGIAPATAIAAETSSPVDAVALQTEDAATEKEKAHAAMQEALKNLEAAKDAASPEKIAEIDTKIAIFQKNYDTNLARAAIYKESLPTMQADIDAAQSECDKAHNRTRDLEAELNKIPHTDYETRWQLELAIMDAQEQESRCEDKLEHCRMRLESQKELHDMMLAEAAKRREPLPAMQADVDAAQAKYDEAHNRVIELQAKLKEAYDNGDYAVAQQLRSEIMMADSRERSCEYELAHYRSRLESQKGHVQYFESAAEEAKASVDESIAKRNALTDDLEKAQAAYDDACKAYEEAKAAADKAASPEITQPTETTPPSSSAQPAETTQPTGSSATGKGAPSSSTKQANTSSGKQATTTADKLVNTGDTAPSAIALAGIAATGLGITATATRRLKNSK